jgi:hypothetical protein
MAMPLMHQIDEKERERIEDFSQELTGDDRLIFLINDGIYAADFAMWLEMDVKTLALAGWDEEPPLPWNDEQFRTYWTCRAKAEELMKGKQSWRKKPAE